ncbi:MAG: peptidoglycan-associated lipoprotein Pal [Alphaproteobacteria bacterium]|nr:peptidoglycan-associated lipoprotein Pal [Alphaproteobacteria bacterium]
MRNQSKLIKFLMIALLSVTISACSSKKDLGDSEGMTIGQPGEYNDGTAVGGTNGYGTAGVDSSIVPGTQADLEAQAGSDLVFFETDQSDLTPSARAILEAQARWLNMYPNLNTTIEGHADERGTREYNLALGDRRATSVKNYLIANGVDPRRVNTISYGKEQPLVVGADGTSWSQNRRAKTRID